MRFSPLYMQFSLPGGFSAKKILTSDKILCIIIAEQNILVPSGIYADPQKGKP